MRITAALGFLLTSTSGPASADTCGYATVIQGYSTGTRCSKWTQHDATQWMVGFLDGLIVASLIGAPPQCVERLSTCLHNKEADQMGLFSLSTSVITRRSGI